jgi:glutaminyl-peptide cyclotransferase
MINYSVRLAGLILIAALFNACGTETIDEDPDHGKVKVLLSKAPQFNEDSAYFFIERQVGFGPRVPLTKPHEQCHLFLDSMMRAYGFEIFPNKGTVIGYDGKRIPLKNIVASFRPELKKRILLAAHWDTRPMADRDTENKDKPIEGANDGASGVAVLLEIARNIQKKPLTNIGIDIIFFDMEDYGTVYCQGSEWWSKYPHKQNYTASYGILLDMVGAKGATFPVEGNSKRYAAHVIQKVWGTAEKLGYGSFFVRNEVQAITDDHYNMNVFAGIPTIDIVHMDPSTSDFGPFHHRHADNLSIIDKKTLKAVGQTVMEVIYSE